MPAVRVAAGLCVEPAASGICGTGFAAQPIVRGDGAARNVPGCPGGEDVRDLIDACGQVVLKREYYFSRQTIERAKKQAREVAAQAATGKI